MVTVVTIVLSMNEVKVSRDMIFIGVQQVRRPVPPAISNDVLSCWCMTQDDPRSADTMRGAEPLSSARLTVWQSLAQSSRVIVSVTVSVDYA